MPRVLLSPLLVASLFLLPAAAGSPEDNQVSAESGCKVPLTTMTFPIGCRLRSTAGIDVTACTGATCTLLMEATSTGSADLPGLLAVQSIVLISDGITGSICLGTKTVSDALPFPCLRICESQDVSTHSACEATFVTTFSLPRGSCVFIDVISIFHYDWEAAEAATDLGWQACRANNDRITITTFG